MRVSVSNNLIRLMMDLGIDPDELKFVEVDKQGTLNTLFMGVTPDMKTPRVESFNNVLGRNILEIINRAANSESCMFIKEEELLAFENYIEVSNMSDEDIDRFIEDDDFQESIGLNLKVYVVKLENFKEA